MKEWKCAFLAWIVFYCAGASAWAAEIHEAAGRGDLDRLKELVAEDPGRVHAVENGLTPLHNAAAGGHLDAAGFLIENGAEVDAANDTGQTPLLYAVSNGKKRMVSFLIEKGADVNAQQDKNPSPLHYAASRGYKSITYLLIDNGARVDIRDHEENTPLHYTAFNGHRAIAMLLIDKGAEIDARNVRRRTPLLLVARECGNAKFAAALADRGADVNAADRFGDTPLTLSAWRGYADVVEVLLGRGAKLPEEREKIMEFFNYTIKKGLTALFEGMVSQGADPFMSNEHNGSLLHSAARGGSTEILALLMDKGLDVDGRDRNGWTPLHCAAGSGHADAVKCLIGKGADLDGRTLSGSSPFNFAMERGHEKLAGLLAAEGADQGPSRFPKLDGDYLGQERPGRTPELFAPGIVSAELTLHGNIVFSPDQSEAYWSPCFPIPGSGYSRSRIMCSKRVNGKWTAPELAPFSNEFGEDVPFFSQDGTRLFFISRRPLDGSDQRTKENIWFMERKGTGWSEPRFFDSAVNSSQMHWQFSMARNDNLYFGTDRGMMLSRCVDGEYAKPKPVVDVLHSSYKGGSPFIEPDERFLIFTSNKIVEGKSDNDLYIGFKRKDGSWTEPIHMGEGINTPYHEQCPVLSHDGEYLFYLSRRKEGPGVYWVKADIIQELEPDGMN